MTRAVVLLAAAVTVAVVAVDAWCARRANAALARIRAATERRTAHLAATDTPGEQK